MSLPAYAIPGDSAVAPFLIEVGLTDAKVVLGQSLARSGLLAHLPVDLLPVLLALLAQVGQTGEVRTTTVEVARILGIHPDNAEARLNRLAAFPTAEQPLIYLRADAWGVSKQYIVPVPASLTLTAQDQPTYRPASKSEVIAHSRKQYATPRQEVERLVEEQLGIEPIPEGDAGAVLQALLNLGVPREVGRELLATYPLARIQAQLHWLPKRAARNPARYLVSAIQKDFGPPGPPSNHPMVPLQSGARVSDE